jgi:glycosyltransferase involved in cell wall biosynthesis
MGSEAFSVIMPAYNGAATIGRAIDSVLMQTDSDWELVVVDDGSRDATRTIVNALAESDSRIRLLVQPRNGGVASARNAGIDAATGRYIAFLDADDYWLPAKLARQRQAFLAGASVVFGSYFRDGANGRKQVPALARVDFRRLLRGNCIGNLTGTYDSAQLGRFHQQPIGHEDYLMWLEVVRKAGKAVGLAEPLAVYSEGGVSLSSNLMRSARWTWAIQRHHLKLPLPLALACFGHYLIGAVGKRVGRRQA